MYKPVVRSAAFAAAVLLWPSVSATAGPCTTSNLSSFSRLGQVVEDARADTPGKLLAAWLLRSRDAGTCKFVFRIDLLLLDGRILSMNFDAETLEPVEIADDRGWVDAGITGVGGETTGSSGSGSGSTAAAPDDDDDDDDDDESESADNSGKGSTNSGSGSSSSGSGSGDDSSGSGSGGDDSGGGDSSGSGSGGDDSGGDDSGGGGSSGSGSGGDD